MRFIEKPRLVICIPAGECECNCDEPVVLGPCDECFESVDGMTVTVALSGSGWSFTDGSFVPATIDLAGSSAAGTVVGTPGQAVLAPPSPNNLWVGSVNQVTMIDLGEFQTRRWIMESFEIRCIDEGLNIITGPVVGTMRMAAIISPIHGTQTPAPATDAVGWVSSSGSFDYKGVAIAFTSCTNSYSFSGDPTGTDHDVSFA